MSSSTTSEESQDKGQTVTVDDLPITFKVKYLGKEVAKGLWGIKHTRRPVDTLVTVAKSLPPNKVLPSCNLTVSIDGVKLDTLGVKSVTPFKVFGIDTISYGVQDLVYTRVFAMIIVRNNYTLDDGNPFEVHAFVCDSRALARQLTYSLAAAFQHYSRVVKEAEEQSPSSQSVRRKFAIDLRSPEEIQQEMDEQETEA